MLPIVLVLLVVPSAFSFPTVGVSQHAIQEIVPLQNPQGRLVSSAVAVSIFDLMDGGDKSVNSLSLGQMIDDMANRPDRYSQAISIAQVLGAIGAIAYGIPGDSCAAAAAINEVLSQVSTGQGIAAWKSQLASNVDVVVQLATNPIAFKYMTGPKGKCPGGGRNFQYETIWDTILNSSTPYNYGLLNEQYCATKRLFQSINIESNNLAAAITASTTEPIIEVVLSNLATFTNFLKLAGSGAPPSVLAPAAAACKTALL